MTTTASRTLQMFRVSWEAKDESGPRALVIMSRTMSFRPRRSMWDCLPLDTFEDLAAAARESWHPTPDEALAASLRYYQDELAHAQKRVTQVQIEIASRSKPKRRRGGS